MEPNENHLEEKAKHLEKKAKQMLKSLGFLLSPNYKEAGETYCELYNIYTDLGLDDPAATAADSAINVFVKDKDWLRAAKVSEEVIKRILHKNTLHQGSLSNRVKTTVELFIKTNQIDAALQLLDKTSKSIHQDDPKIATDMIKLAIHIAEVEGRPKQAEIFKTAKSNNSNCTQNASSDPESSKLEFLDLNFHDLMTSSGQKKMTKSAVKGVASAVETTIVPLSAALYSGAGGYASVRPGWIGLTPGQFREIRSFFTVFKYFMKFDNYRKFEDDRQNEQEITITSSLV
jgi:hypothetical protein